MPDGSLTHPNRPLLTEAGGGAVSGNFDGDCPLSKNAAHASGNLSMQLEIAEREQLIATITGLAMVTEGKGYRFAAALLLEVAANVERALLRS